MLLVTSTTPESQEEFENEFDINKEFSLISDLCQHCRLGSFSQFSQDSLFQMRNTDFSTPNSTSDFDSQDMKSLNSSDILYLNIFRLFNFVVKARNSPSGKSVVHRLVYFPNVTFKVTLIHQPFKLVSTPLATLVTKKQRSEIHDPRYQVKSQIKFGFVSLDANQRMLLIPTSDHLATKIPLIGLWIYGINPQIELLHDDDSDKKVLQSILFEYINCNLENRYSFDQMKKTFLVAIFSPEEGAKYYETEFVSVFELKQ